MHGTLWNIASKLPVYGDDITAVQGMTSVVDSLIGDSVPQFMNVLTTLKNAQLSTGDGQLNIQPILEAQKTIVSANESLQQQVQKYQNLPKAHIGIVNDAYNTGKTQLRNWPIGLISYLAYSRFRRIFSALARRVHTR